MSDVCIVCNTSVSGRKHAVTCDVCERWQHRLCDTDIALADYRAAVEKELYFVCRDCSNSIPLLDPEDDVESMDEAEPSSMGVPVAESTLALWDEMNVLQVSFQKAESDANYLAQKLDLEFENDEDIEVNPVKMQQKLNDVKKEYSALVEEAASIQKAQQEAVKEFQTQISTTCQLLQKIQSNPAQDGERPAEIDELEKLLGVKFPTTSEDSSTTQTDTDTSQTDSKSK